MNSPGADVESRNQVLASLTFCLRMGDSLDAVLDNARHILPSLVVNEKVVRCGCVDVSR